MISWIKKAIIYHIFIDRFAGYDTECNDKLPDFCGGNIKAIISKLDYLKTLGTNTIWISPFYETTSYHGYHITNFDKIDTRFGSIEDLKELIKDCKAKQLKIIADVVPNHCSNQHPWFVDAKTNLKSIYKDWFYFTKWPEKYNRFMEYDEIPKINLENPATAEYMIDSLLNWASLGFDGFRIDHVIGIPDLFLINLRKKLLGINPTFILIGEAWAEGSKYKHLKTIKIRGKYKLWKNGFEQNQVQKHYEGIIDGVFDFSWRSLILNNLKQINSKPEGLLKNLEKHKNFFGENFILPKFLDNHDTNRVMFECKNNKKTFKSTLKLLFEEEQPIVLYYGTEYGLTHKQSVLAEIGYSDLNARQKMPWSTKPAYFDFISKSLKSRS